MPPPATAPGTGLRGPRLSRRARVLGDVAVTVAVDIGLDVGVVEDRAVVGFADDTGDAGGRGFRA